MIPFVDLKAQYQSIKSEIKPPERHADPFATCLHFARLPARGFSETERQCERVLSLPMFPELSDEQMNAVAGVIF